MRATTAALVAASLCLAASFTLRAGTHSQASALKTVQQKFDAFNRHDADAIERIYANKAHLHTPDYPDLVGNEPIADTYRKLFAAIPDAEDSLTLVEAAGQRVYVQFVLSGHLGGAQEKPVSVRIISVYRIEGDKIVQDDTYYDRKI